MESKKLTPAEDMARVIDEQIVKQLIYEAGSHERTITPEWLESKGFARVTPERVFRSVPRFF